MCVCFTSIQYVCHQQTQIDGNARQVLEVYHLKKGSCPLPSWLDTGEVLLGICEQLRSRMLQVASSFLECTDRLCKMLSKDGEDNRRAVCVLICVKLIVNMPISGLQLRSKPNRWLNKGILGKYQGPL